MFAEFEKYLKGDWKEAAKTEIKGKTLEEVINWQTEEGFHLSAFYQKGDTEQLAYLKKFHALLFNPEQVVKTPRNSQKITVLDAEKANKIALTALENGVNEICFHIGDRESLDFSLLLHDILLPYCAVSFSCLAKDAIYIIKEYILYAPKCGYDLATLVGSIYVIDQENLDIEILKTLLENTEKASNFLVIDISGGESKITDRNATLLAKTVKIINALLAEGFSIENIIRKVQLSTFIGNQYFVEIAGLRALRMLFGSISQAYGVNDYQFYQVHIHALTSVDADKKEPDWNMISNTTQAMSAMVGGCNVLSVVPHQQDNLVENSFAARIARNVHSLLIEESYLDKASDIAAGSYYIDILTDKIAEVSWEKFKQLLEKDFHL